MSPDKFGTVSAVESCMTKTLQDVLNVNYEIFKAELCHCITVKAKLIMQEGANPKFCNHVNLLLQLWGMSWTD